LPPATHTNVYLIGEAGVCAVDPASPYPEEQAALDAALDALAAEGHPLVEVVLTHHHVDHVSGAAHLVERYQVPVAAHPETARRVAGRVEVTHLVDDGDVIPYGPTGLRALFTPGHAPGHLCFSDSTSGAMVAGDMVASVGTIIVEPSDGGDMAEYLQSLRRVRSQRPRVLLPAHGPPIEDADGKLDFYVAHRLQREARVFAALSVTEPRTVEELVPPAYPDVSPAIYALAARSLLAHLIKLERDRRARRDGDRWLSVTDC
jgi:glyoxylase-like metal-dependent hydrolase (beta-lactamase superfamily II)